MEKIVLKCGCGAEIELNDKRQIFINSGGKLDDNGRMFIIQRQADAWLDRHQGCVKKAGA